MSPMRIPLDIRSTKNRPSTSSMRDRPFDVLHAYARPERGLPAILVGDHGRQLDRVPARVEGVDDGRVLLRDVPPADLSGAGDFGVVGVEVFGEQQEPPDSGRVRQRGVALTDLLPDQRAHLGLLGEVRVARVREPAPLRPVAHGVRVDRDHRRDERALTAERDRLADVGAELELVLDELGRERRPVGQRADETPFAPQFIENKLKFSPYVREAVAFGGERAFVAAMIAIDPNTVGNWAERRGLPYTSYTDLSQKPEVRALIREEIRKCNATLPDATRVRRFLLLTKDLDADDAEVTRTRKVRRRYVAEKYAAVVDAFYSGGDAVELTTMITYEDGRQAALRSRVRVEDVEGAVAHA